MMYVADTSDCKACSYELEEKEVGIKGFMEYYYEECLDKPEIEQEFIFSSP